MYTGYRLDAIILDVILDAIMDTLILPTTTKVISQGDGKEEDIADPPEKMVNDKDGPGKASENAKVEADNETASDTSNIEKFLSLNTMREEYPAQPFLRNQFRNIILRELISVDLKSYSRPY